MGALLSLTVVSREHLLHLYAGANLVLGDFLQGSKTAAGNPATLGISLEVHL